MTPWWANLISVFIGAVLGGASSLWGVKLVQDRTDKRERHKLEAEKPSRLRPDRISLLYEVGEMLHDLDAPLDVMLDRSEGDEDQDWTAVAAGASEYIDNYRKIDIRLRLLFQHDHVMVESWNTLGGQLGELGTTVEQGHFAVTPAWTEDIEANSRAHWGIIIDSSRNVQRASRAVSAALAGAMRRIDTE
jgi:hypothetical protein